MDILNMLPRTEYSIQGVDYILTNLSANVNISTKTSKSLSLFIDHQILDGQSARDISSLLYENDTYYWTIFVVNGMTNSVNDWPKSENEIYKQIVAEYGYDDVDTVIAYADPSGNQVDIVGLRFQESIEDVVSDSSIISIYNLIPVTRFEIEKMKNDLKRQVKLIDPDYISEFIIRYREALK